MEPKEFIKEKRKLVKLTQTELALKVGVRLRFMRELEHGKQTLRLDKVNQVLKLFGYEVRVMPVSRHHSFSRKTITGLKTSTPSLHKHAWAIPGNSSVVHYSQNPGHLQGAWKRSGCW